MRSASVVKNRWAGGVTNGWMLSGISNYQSGPNLQSVISSNFGVNGSITVPVGAVAVGRRQHQHLHAVQQHHARSRAPARCRSATPTCLARRMSTCSPRLLAIPTPTNRSAQQFINASAFSLPALGTNGPYKFGYLPGPGFFDTDLTAEKSFRISRTAATCGFRVAAFNFINHANNAFANGINPNAYTMNFSQTVQTTNVNQALASANCQHQPGFGYANVKEGRRIMELGLHFDF